MRNGTASASNGVAGSSAMTDSWRFELYRAEEHFAYLNELIGIPIGR